MNRHRKLFQARRQRADQITDRMLAACAQPPEQQAYARAETIDEFLSRGGRIKRLPPERKGKK